MVINILCVIAGVILGFALYAFMEAKKSSYGDMIIDFNLESDQPVTIRLDDPLDVVRERKLVKLFVTDKTIYDVTYAPYKDK